jgi:cyanate permease
MEATHTGALATYDRLRRALVPVIALALVGWIGLWFRWEHRWLAFVVWGVGNGLGVILAIALALARCPRCQQRGFGGSLWRTRCRSCGLEGG